MKRTIKMDARDGDAKVSVKFNIMIDELAKYEADILIKDVKDKLMQLLPTIRFCDFKMCDAKFGA